jgi:hypothetical protein
MQQAPGPHPYFGPLFIAVILGFHFATTKLKKEDAILVVLLFLLGMLVDSLYIAGGMIRYQGGYESAPWLAPLWITSLWALYAISVNHSLSWMQINLGLAAIMGACGAISSYLVGIKLGAAEFLIPEFTALAIIGCVWAVVVPVSLFFSSYLIRIHTQR